MAANFNKEQIGQLREAYNHFDVDFDQAVSFAEFKKGFQQIDQNFTYAELLAMFKGVDVDGDDEIDFNEFATLMASQVTKPGQTIFNRKSDGSLDMQPVVNAFKTIRP